MIGTHRIRTLLGVIAIAAACASAFAEDTPDDLVARLPTGGGTMMLNNPDAKDLVALGDHALDALEKELHFETPGQLDHEKSRRDAVVTVVARIPGERSTDLLVRSLSLSQDNESMWRRALYTLEKRPLAEAQLISMIGNRMPEVVIVAIRKAAPVAAAGPLHDAVAAVFDQETARQRFAKRYGTPDAAAEELWKIRLAAGQALCIDMVPEMRALASTIIGRVKEAVNRPDIDEHAAPLSGMSMSWSDIEIARSIERLGDLGASVRDVVVAAAASAKGDLRAVLDLAAFAMGDTDRLPSVTKTMLDAANPNRRVSAALVLFRTKDRRAIPALWKALGDPFHRQEQSCVGPPEQEYPVRKMAEWTLIALGENADAVRAKAREGVVR